MSDLITAARRWLKAKGVTQWWNWDIQDDTELDQAAEHWVQQYHDFRSSLNTADFANANKRSSSWPPPTIRDHEIALVEAGWLEEWGPNSDLSGTNGADPEWERANDLYEKFIQEGAST